MASSDGQSQKKERKLKLSRRELGEALLKPSVLSVFILVILWNLSIDSKTVAQLLQRRGGFWETLAEIRDINLQMQLRFYEVLVSLRPIKMQPEPIRLIYIDDMVHWERLYGTVPTDRTFLADLVRHASESKPKPAAIGLDVELLMPPGFPAASDLAERSAGRKGADDALADALRFASNQGVPVVLAMSYYAERTGRGRERVRIPSIFTDGELPLQRDDGSCPSPPPNPQNAPAAREPYPRCVSFGFINAPNDRREIPLSEKVLDPGSGVSKEYDSFALALAKAATGWRRDSNEYYPFIEAQTRGKPVFGSFLREPSDEERRQIAGRRPLDRTVFREVDTLDLALGTAEAESACAKKILLIGGRWHDLEGHGPAVDAHLSPVGIISGVAFHANYLASMLQGQFATEVNVWVGVFIDLMVGLVIYVTFELAKGWQEYAVLAAAALISPAVAYCFLVSGNRYLDFLLPIELYFLHILYEMIKNYWKLKNKSQPPAASPATVQEVKPVSEVHP